MQRAYAGITSDSTAFYNATSRSRDPTLSISRQGELIGIGSVDEKKESDECRQDKSIGIAGNMQPTARPTHDVVEPIRSDQIYLEEKKTRGCTVATLTNVDDPEGPQIYVKL